MAMAKARLSRHTRWSALVGAALVTLAAAGVTMASHAGAATDGVGVVEQFRREDQR
jgi:hypothetical protein